jgi:hypothetical protein
MTIVLEKEKLPEVMQNADVHIDHPDGGPALNPTAEALRQIPGPNKKKRRVESAFQTKLLAFTLPGSGLAPEWRQMEQLQSWRGTTRLLGNTVAFVDDSKRIYHGSKGKPQTGCIGMSLVMDQDECDMNEMDAAIEQRVAGKSLHLLPLVSSSSISFDESI